MQQLLRRLYNLKPYTDQIEQRQATAAYLVATVNILLFLLLLPVLVFFAVANPAVLSHAMVVILFIPAGAILLWVSLQFGHLNLARVLLFGASIFVYIYAMATLEGAVILLVFPAFFLAMAALLLDWRRVFLLGIAYDVILVIGFLQWSGWTIDDITIAGASYFMVTVLNTTLARGWQQGLTLISETVAMQRLRMVELSAEVSQLIFQRTDLETLMTDTVNAIRDRFESIYHAQIFLVDGENHYAVLKASTGQAGQELLWRGHRLEVGSESVIGRVTVQGKPVLARDTSSDSMHFRNELLPATRTELALPLISNNQVIGALDVQSSQPDAFSPDDIGVLEALASQIAVALDNARLFEEQQLVIAENQRLAQQAHNQVRQIQDLNQRLTRQAWGDYLEQQDLAPALTVDFNSAAITPNATWTPGLAEAVNSGKLVKQMEIVGEDTATVAVPLIIRGQVIGAMEFEVAQSAPPTPDEENLIQNVASRLALSLESSRLYDEAQRLAQREQVINDITSRLQTAAGMEGALLMAAQGLQNALNAPHVAIRLGTLSGTSSSPDNDSIEQESA